MFYIIISISAFILFFWSDLKAEQDALTFYTKQGIKIRKVDWTPEHDKRWHYLIIPRATSMFFCGFTFCWSIYFATLLKLATLLIIIPVVLIARHYYFEWRLDHWERVYKK